jgi:hypothetical protein
MKRARAVDGAHYLNDFESGEAVLDQWLKQRALCNEGRGSMLGVKALMVHALSNRAKRFYEAQGFYPSPTHPRTLFLPLAEVGL